MQEIGWDLLEPNEEGAGSNLFLGPIKLEISSGRRLTDWEETQKSYTHRTAVPTTLPEIVSLFNVP